MADNKKKNAPKKTPKKENESNSRLKSLSFIVIVVLLSVYAFKVTNQFTPPVQAVPYSGFSRIINDTTIRIKDVVISKNEQGFELKGTIAKSDLLTDSVLFRSVESIVGDTVSKARNLIFTSFYPQFPQLLSQQLTERGIPFAFKAESSNWLGMFLSTLPWLLMILFWIFIFRQMQGGGGSGGTRGLFSFGKSKARAMPMDLPKTTFEDVAGVDEAKQELEEVIDFLKDPKKYQALGGKIPKGVLLLGAPGTGKTLLARAVAGQAGVPFFSISGSDFVEMFVGVGASRVRDLFEQGKKNAPCIIIIDEIDAVGRHRGAGLGGGHDEREQTLNQLLVEMDGFEVNTGVILIAATNRPDVLDPALLRPGRFDRQVVVDRPDLRGRLGILKVHVRKVPLSKDVDLDLIARGTPGVSGAELANMVNEAALLAARFGQKEVTMLDFEEAKDKVLMGTERRSMLISDKEKKIIAIHEAGHALTGKYLKNADPVHKVTIIPRGLALGVTYHLPDQDKHINTRAFYLDEITVLFGGRVAEELAVGEISTGASNDIEKASAIARKMVCDWGMSERMGPIAYGQKQEQIFLGREISQHRDFSDVTAKIIDDEIKRIIDEQLALTRKILTENRDKLDILALAVLENESLDAEEINKVLAGEKLEGVKKPRVVPVRRKAEKIGPDGKPVQEVTPVATAATDTPTDAQAPDDKDKGKSFDQKA
ncbi:MAG: ATP-dependent zinc metalloprotease FtsH [Fibrobacterota bacterium]